MALPAPTPRLTRKPPLVPTDDTEVDCPLNPTPLQMKMNPCSSMAQACGLPNDLDIDSQAKPLPRTIRGVNSRFAIDGQRQAGPVAERKAKWPGLSDHLGRDAGLMFIVGTNLNSHFGDSAPRKVRRHASQQKPGIHLCEVNGAKQRALKQRRNVIAARLVKDHRENRGRVEHRTTQATPPSPGALPRGARR